MEIVKHDQQQQKCRKSMKNITRTKTLEHQFTYLTICAPKIKPRQMYTGSLQETTVCNFFSKLLFHISPSILYIFIILCFNSNSQIYEKKV